jgi:phosphatidate cytidylyltransferase
MNPLTVARRVASGVCLAIIAGGALFAGGVAVWALLALAVGIAVWEFSDLLERMGSRPPAWLIYPLTALLAFRFLLPGDVPALEIGLGAATVAGLLGVLVLEAASPARFSAAITGALYLGLTSGYYLALLQWGSHDATRAGDRLGLRIVGLALGAAILGDVVAYAAGSVFGRHRFFASLSPRKSLEGAIAGAAVAVLWVAAAGPLLIGITWDQAVPLGVLLAVASQGGDLVESALKRQARVKDSGHLIPGHGGVLDRLDSLLFVGPVVYCYLRAISLR